jgi:hypothetical protein
MKVTNVAIVLLFGGCKVVGAAEFPKPVEGDAVLKDFRFASGDTMP